MEAIWLSLPWIHAENQKIKDEQGRLAALRGIASQYNCYKYTLDNIREAWIPRLKFLKQQGFSCSRLHMYKFHEPYFRYDWLDMVLDLFEQYGVYCFLTADYGENDLEPYWNDGSWINGWVQTAQRYADRPVVAAYELANEGKLPLDPGGESTSTRRAYKECIAAVRQHDQKHMLVCYNPVSNWRAIEMAIEYPTTAWLRSNALWVPEDMPSDPNIAFKTGSHWLVLRDYVLTGHAPDHPAYLYYADKFDLAHVWASGGGHALRKWREYFNRPTVMYEFMPYDPVPQHANYAGVKEWIRQCEMAEIPWNYHVFDEHIIGWSSQTYPDWRTYLNNLLGKYASPYFDGLLEPYQAKPFNLTDHVTGLSSPWRAYGPTEYTMWDQNYSITIRGPCMVRQRIFDLTITPYIDLRKLTNLVEDNIIEILDEEVRFGGENNKPSLITPYVAPTPITTIIPIATISLGTVLSLLGLTDC